MKKKDVSLATVNVIILRGDGINENMEIFSFPDTEEGIKQADACFIRTCVKLFRSFKNLTKKRQIEVLKNNGAYYRDDDISDAEKVGITYSTPWDGQNER